MDSRVFMGRRRNCRFPFVSSELFVEFAGFFCKSSRLEESPVSTCHLSSWEAASFSIGVQIVKLSFPETSMPEDVCTHAGSRGSEALRSTDRPSLEFH